MKKLSALFIVLIALVSFGCKQRMVTQPEQMSQEKKEEATKPSAEEVTEQKMGSEVESVEEKNLAAQAGMEKEGMFEDILFDFDRYDVKTTYKPELKEISSWMMKNSDSKLLIEGHCDERGTNEYNLALGDKRANSVKDYLLSLGVSSSRIETISYGEEKPLCTESTEECWAKNRRGHFIVMNKAGK